MHCLALCSTQSSKHTEHNVTSLLRVNEADTKPSILLLPKARIVKQVNFGAIACLVQAVKGPTVASKGALHGHAVPQARSSGSRHSVASIDFAKLRCWPCNAGELCFTAEGLA